MRLFKKARKPYHKAVLATIKKVQRITEELAGGENNA